MKKNFAEILKGVENDSLRKLKSKVPEWEQVSDRLSLPLSLALEQCSSSSTARQKAELIPQGARLADLTGGLGVDCAEFCRRCSAVLYNERNPELREAAEHNFHLLGIGNASFSSVDIAPDRLDAIRDFAPDWIYLDPARRSGSGRKVFRIEDCSPNVTILLDSLYDITGHVMVKLSPMADISELTRKLRGIKEVHIHTLAGECKELVCLLEKGYEGEVTTVVGEFRFTPSEAGSASVNLTCAVPKEGDILYEPSAGINKAGCYGLLCGKYALKQIGKDCHLFVGNDFPEDGKRFVIERVFPMGNEGIRAAGKACPAAEVSSRGLKISSEDLRAKLKVRPDPEHHIFGVNAAEGGKLLLCCRKIISFQNAASL